MAQVIISASNIKKTYRRGFFKKYKTEAVKGITLDIIKGELFGILGPNGAGKTTFLNIIMGLLLPDEGSLKIAGCDVLNSDSCRIRRRMNMSSGNPNYPWCLSVREMLSFYGMLYGLWGKTLNKKIESLIEMLMLDKYKDTRYDELSTGNKQRLSIAKALINDPEILLLDEPTTGMDPNISIHIREMIKRIHKKRGITVLLTTHYMREAEELCSRIAFIKEGSIAALGTKEYIKEQTNTNDMEEAFIELVAD